MTQEISTRCPICKPQGGSPGETRRNRTAGNDASVENTPVYDAAWTHIVNNDPFRDTTRDEERKEALREKVFALAQGSVDFDTLLNAVMSNISEPWAMLVPPKGKGFPKPRAN